MVDFLDSPGLLQNTFESNLGLAPTGRNRYQQWLADQFAGTASNFLLQQEGLGRSSGLPSDPGQTFRNYLQSLPGSPGVQRGISRVGEEAGFDFANLPDADRGALLERLPDFVQQQILLGGFRGRYGNFASRGLTDQAFSAPNRRQFEISDFAQQAQGGTFLGYLRDRYGLDTRVAQTR